MEDHASVKVVVRVRPSDMPAVRTEGCQVALNNPYCIVDPQSVGPGGTGQELRSHLTRRENASLNYTFDGCYSGEGPHQQAQLYEEIGRPV